VGDPPPQQQNDPTEPIDRNDSSGQLPASIPPQSAFPETTPQQSTPPQVSNRPAYGTPATLTLKPGTFFTVRTNEMLASNRNKPGDIFTATLTQPLIAGGVVVAQRGQTVAGTVAETGKDKDGKHFIRLQLTSITAADGTQVPVQTQLASMRGGSTPGGIEAGTVIATTATGAAIGGIAAWGTGAAIGAGAGALVGLAAVVATHNHPAAVFPETALTFQITAPVTISTANSPMAFRFAGPEDYQPQPTLVRGGPRPGYPAPYPAPYGAAFAPGYAYPPAYVYGPGYYPGYYPYWGARVCVVVGRGWGYRHW
jgi:hypothetical protein